MDIEEQMEKYTTYLLKLAYLYVKDRQVAEDLVQDVFITIFYKQHLYIEEGKMKSYLVKMTINKCKDYLKSWTYRMVQVKEVFEKKIQIKTNDELVLAEETSMIGQAVLDLPIKYREPIILYYFEEQSVKEISNSLNIPIGTVKTRMTKARTLLKESLNNADWEVLLNET